MAATTLNDPEPRASKTPAETVSDLCDFLEKYPELAEDVRMLREAKILISLLQTKGIIDEA
jgi:hypothetical protein